MSRLALGVPILALLAGCSVESRLVGTWSLDKLVRRANDETIRLDYPLSELDRCVFLWGYSEQDCEGWGYTEERTTEFFYVFSRDLLTVVLRECFTDACNTRSDTNDYAGYELEGEHYLGVSGYSYYGYGYGSSLRVGFDGGKLKLADVGWDCRCSYPYYYYYYYYYDDECTEGCTEDAWVWTFSRL